MILPVLLSWITTLGIGAVAYDSTVDSLTAQVSADSLAAVIAGLSGEVSVTIDGKKDSIPCRFAYTEGAYKAARWLAERFQARGFEAELQPIEITASPEPRPLPLGTTEEKLRVLLRTSQPQGMYNVVATLAGKDSQQVLLTAHYDARSEDQDIWRYTPGADDNASGVAGVLEAARIMAAKKWQHTLRFVLFSGEEISLYGSEYYVKEAVKAGDSMLGCLNLDMIGYNKDAIPEVDIHCNPWQPPSQSMGDTLVSLIEVYGLNLSADKHVQDAIGASDHYWFWLYAIPATLLIEDMEDFTPYYHTINDRLQTLERPYMAEATRLAVSWAATRSQMLKGEPAIVSGEIEELTSIRLSSSVVCGGVLLELSSPCEVTPAILDATGRRVKTLDGVPGSGEPTLIRLDLSDLPRGVYWIKVQGTQGPVSERFVLIR